MELPSGGPSLRHYTQTRPRPHRQNLNHRPSRQQEPIIESENEGLDHMGRVDEGVEEFFTKRVLPADTLKNEDEISPVTVQESLHTSAASCPPPTRTLRRKLGDFFTLRKRRGLKTETSQEGRAKKASIADLIRPLREAARAEKDKNKVKENDKENEKEKQKEKADGAGDKVVEETPGPVPLRRDAAPPRRALREGKSQSLILLSGSAAPGTGSIRHTAKKSFDGQQSFEQKLSLMLQRIGVTKPQPAEEQSPEGEMKKADSEGTIIDNKPDPPPTFSKPRTMSTSSDTRHQIRQSASAHESAGKPALPPKPVIKPGVQQPQTSGRSTPDNELAKIQEADTSTPSKACPPDLSVSSPSSCNVPSAASPLTGPSISTSITHSDTIEAASQIEAASPGLVDSSTVIATTGVTAAVSPTQPLSSSAVTNPTSSTEALSPVPTPSTTATVPSTSPLSPTPISIPTTSSETLLPLPASSTSFESITLVPPNTSTHSPSPVPNAAVTNCAGSASISQSPSSDTTTVDTEPVVSAGIFQNALRCPATHAARSITPPGSLSTADIFTSSETPASSVVTPAQGLVDASSFCETTVATDPIPSNDSTASSCVKAATANVTSPVATDSAGSILPPPRTQPGLPLPSDTAITSCPKSSTSGAPDAAHPSDTATPPSISTSHSETHPASVNLPVTNNHGATPASSICTPQGTEVPSVTMPTAASPPDPAGPTRHGRAEDNNVQTPPEEPPRRDSPRKEKAADDDVDRDVQRSEQNERHGNSQEDRSNKHSDVEGEEAQQITEREDHSTVGGGPGPETARAQRDDQQNGTEGRPQPQLEETSTIHEK
ncbi:unnamed protein product [Lota lota]